MLSAVVLAFDPPVVGPLRVAVARSLASLVEACVEGLVADAILAGPPNLGLEKIADEAGCALIEAADARTALAGALQRARQAHVFVLAAGAAPERGFLDEVRDVLTCGDGARARVLRAAPDSLLTRLAPRLAKPVGLIARKEDCRIAGDIAALARSLRARDLSTTARRVM
ncbi:MAG: transposase [Methylocystis sp.]|nr:transposase [Methylocystis sp.]MBI3275633.1 transposase [Methylocystis sp.]